MKNRTYTFAQLDLILHKRGATNERGYFAARLYSTLHAVAQNSRISLFFLDKQGGLDFRVADVWSVAGGDTTYRVFAPSADSGYRRNPMRRSMYRKAVHRFTPRVITGRTPKDDEWYRLHDGVASTLAPTSYMASHRQPGNHWRTQPRCTRPSYAEWLAPHKAHHPKLCGRAKAFYIRLRRELEGGLPCVVQLLRPMEWLMTSGGVQQSGPMLHVCLPPTEKDPSAQLYLSVGNHSADTRKRLHVDGDFAIRHSRVLGVAASPSGGPGGQKRFEWKSTKDAIIGVKEWVLGSVYIPGL
jgi:hypothetical protein